MAAMVRTRMRTARPRLGVGGLAAGGRDAVAGGGGGGGMGGLGGGVREALTGGGGVRDPVCSFLGPRKGGGGGGERERGGSGPTPSLTVYELVGPICNRPLPSSRGAKLYSASSS